MANKYIALIIVQLLQSTLFAQTYPINSQYANPPITRTTSATLDSSKQSVASTPSQQKNDSTGNSDLNKISYFKSGDAIKISVYPDSSHFLNGFYNIDQSGFVDLPILGLVSVKNKSSPEFVECLKNNYSEYLRYPNINIISYTRISFFGGFNRPGLYWIESRNSLWEAIQVAGGVNREDGLKKIRWERNGMVVSDNITADFQAGTSLQLMGFQSGDQLCVTAKSKQLFWESFRQDVVPILSISLTALTTALMAYQTYKVNNNR